jgi:hypothetical protein
VSTIVAQYGFLSWLRRGVATQIPVHESDGSAAPRARVPITVAFNAEAVTATVTLDLLGAGELGGFDPRSVIRTWPRPDVFDAESNYFPIVEFDQPDLPWRLTPASAETNDRLRPWLALVVVKDGEATLAGSRGDGRPPTLSVDSADTLPDLSQAFAWAHAQVNGETNVSAERLAQLLQTEPWRVTSRILCPRQLEPLTKYDACLVPALERGRRAGLREEVPDAVPGLEPAWKPGQAGVLLPVLHHWRFQTGVAGDFEALVRRLQPRLLPPEVGIRDMDVSDPGGALRGVPAHDRPLGLEGALKTAMTTSTPWPPTPTRTTFLDRLKNLLNLPAQLLGGTAPLRAIAPPLYGRWHAAADRLEPGTPPVWFHETNQDPRLRVTAGLGTQVVRQEQRSLMASAWLQVEGIRKANEELRLAQLAREIAVKLHTRHVTTAGVEEVVRLTTAVHARVKASPLTVRAVLERSPVPVALVDAQFRRLTRPLGPLGRRQGRPDRPAAPTLLSRVNDGTLAIAAPPSTPEMLPTTTRLAARVVAPVAATRYEWLRRLPPWFIALVLILLTVLLIALGPLAILTAIVLAVVAALVARPQLRELLDALRAAFAGEDSQADAETRAQAIRDGKLTVALIKDAPPQPNFVLRRAPAPGTPPLPPPSRTGGTDSADARVFRRAAVDVLTDFDVQPGAGAVLRQVALPEISAKLVTALDPRTTINASVRARLTIDPRVKWEPADPIEPVMMYPIFDRPMYEPLRDLGQDFLLPGLDRIPVDTVALLVTNQPFVEAYMLGLNHEMARELLWNEFPTDQRGSYFRQFWDVRGAEPSPGETLDPEKLKDIKEIHTWRKTAHLGQSSARPPLPNNEERVVLLVRGELFRRYPNTEVYALSAVAGTGTRRNLGADRKNPIFRGSLRPDVTFFGFDLTPTQVVGAEDPTDPTANQGWFFVLEEQSVEPRFGLDVATTFGGSVADFNNLSWGHLAASAVDLAGIRHIDLNAELPDTRPVASTSAPAWHADSGLGRTNTRSAEIAEITLQRPVRIAIHASDMLRGTR